MKQGDVLTASNNLADVDGVGAISYQWFANGVAINGATGASLTLDQAQVGKTMSVKANYTDGFGARESVSSLITSSVANVNDAPTGAIDITRAGNWLGEPITTTTELKQGHVLMVSSSLADIDGVGAVSYQWFANGVAINGATNASLTLVQAHVGKAISVKASYTDGCGTLESMNSLTTKTVSTGIGTDVISRNGVAITAATTLKQGDVLTASNSLAAEYAFFEGCQWFADGVAIEGANGDSLMLGQEQVGKTISVKTSYYEPRVHCTIESEIGLGTSSIANVNDAPTGAVAINLNGGAVITAATALKQGDVLTASNNLADVDGLGAISYQWFAGGAAISGATSNTLTLAQAQVGKTISVKASYTDGFGTLESVSSLTTSSVANVNDAPTGAVAINLNGGAVITAATALKQGDVLTASNNLADVDGLEAISYQWFANGVAISGAISGTLTLAQAQVGKTISVKANYTDGFGTLESVSSLNTSSVANVNDAPTGSVVISLNGAAMTTATVLRSGDVLTASNSLADVDGLGAISYQWFADGAAISGATGASLTLGQAQARKIISVKASYTDGFGALESVNSLNTPKVNSAPTGEVAINLNSTAITAATALKQGDALRASNSLLDADGMGAISYQWFANGVAISGATSNTLTLAQAQVGKTMSVKASYTDGLGALESVNSLTTSSVANVNDAPTGTVTMSLGGNAITEMTALKQGDVLTASHTLADIDGMGAVSYQWFANGVAINGATGANLTLGQAHVGKAMSVKASYTDGYGTLENVESLSTGIVANVNDAPTGTVAINLNSAAITTMTALKQGDVLSASNNLADADGMNAVSYQWFANGVAIEGAIGASLLLGQEQVGRNISVKASYTDGFGAFESVSSLVTSSVANVNDAPMGEVTMRLDKTVVTAATVLKQGDVLTASNNLANDIDGMGAISYQWFADAVAIEGASGASFALTQAQVGKAITVKAGYIDGFGTFESVSSTASAIVGINNDLLEARRGIELLFGGAGNDGIYDRRMDTSDALFGGTGNDEIGSSRSSMFFQFKGGRANFIVGGAGNDTITLGTSADVVAFNAGDGADTLDVLSYTDFTLSLGGGIKLSELTLQQSSGGDLILNTNASKTERITLKGWMSMGWTFSSEARTGKVNLQVMVDASDDYLSTSADRLKNKRVVNLDFQALTERFRYSGTAVGGSWSVMNAALTAYLSSSDNMALGGELAYQYGEGNIGQLSVTSAQTTLTSNTYGSSAQAVTVGLTLPAGQVGLTV